MNCLPEKKKITSGVQKVWLHTAVRATFYGPDPQFESPQRQEKLNQKWTRPWIVNFVMAAYYSVLYTTHAQSFSSVFVISCVPKSHPPLRLPHMGRCLGSCIICWRSRPACVNKCVCQFNLYMSVHACVQRVGQAVEGTETACSWGEVSVPTWYTSVQ